MTTTLQHLRQLDQQATESPWAWLPNDVPPAPGFRFGGESAMNESGYAVGSQDAELIAAMRNALPALLDIAEAAEEYNRLSWSHDDHPVLRRLREALNRLNT